MSRRHDKLLAMFYFLEERERNHESFELEDLVEVTGYKLSSVMSYFRGRLRGEVVHEGPEGGLIVRGVSRLGPDRFVTYMIRGVAPPAAPEPIAPAPTPTPTPAAPEPEPVEPATPEVAPAGGGRMAEAMLARSASSARVALTLYHDPYCEDRVQLSMNALVRAWELLFRAELVRVGGPAGLYGAPRAPEDARFDLLVGKLLANPRDPVRRNLEWLHQLASVWGDALAPELRPYLSRLMQAGVSNYVRRFEAVARRRLVEVHAGALALGCDGPVVALSALEEAYGAAWVGRVASLLRTLRLEELELASDAFCAEGGWALELQRVSGLEPARLAGGEGSQEAAALVDATLGTRVYPFSTEEILPEVNRHLPHELRLSASAIARADRAERVREGAPNRFFARGPRGEPRYARAWVDWLVRAALRGERFE